MFGEFLQVPDTLKFILYFQYHLLAPRKTHSMYHDFLELGQRRCTFNYIPFANFCLMRYSGQWENLKKFYLTLDKSLEMVTELNSGLTVESFKVKAAR
jgi:hypothetical protein